MEASRKGEVKIHSPRRLVAYNQIKKRLADSPVVSREGFTRIAKTITDKLIYTIYAKIEEFYGGCRNPKTLRKTYRHLALIYHPDKVTCINLEDLSRIGVTGVDLNSDSEYIAEIAKIATQQICNVYSALIESTTPYDRPSYSSSSSSSSFYTDSSSSFHTDSSSRENCSWCDGNCTCEKSTNDFRFRDSYYEPKKKTHYESHDVNGKRTKFKVYENANFSYDDIEEDDDPQTWHWAKHMKFFRNSDGKLEHRYPNHPFEYGFGGLDGCDMCGHTECNCFGQMDDIDDFDRECRLNDRNPRRNDPSYIFSKDYDPYEDERYDYDDSDYDKEVFFKNMKSQTRDYKLPDDFDTHQVKSFIY